MRDVLRNELGKRGLPLIGAHMGGTALGRENSVAAVKGSLRYQPDIIEIDVRKSRDGILYGYHGSIPFGVLFISPWLRFLSFAAIRRIVGPVDTLQDIADAMQEEAIFYLDLKENSVTASDIRHVLAHCKSTSIWIAPYSLRRIADLRRELGEACVYILNRPFVPLGKLPERAQGVADIIFLVRWQYTAKNIARIRSLGIEPQLARFFLSDRRRYELRARFRSPMWGYDDVREGRKYGKEQMANS